MIVLLWWATLTRPWYRANLTHEYSVEYSCKSEHPTFLRCIYKNWWLLTSIDPCNNRKVNVSSCPPWNSFVLDTCRHMLMSAVFSMQWSDDPYLCHGPMLFCVKTTRWTHPVTYQHTTDLVDTNTKKCSAHWDCYTSKKNICTGHVSQWDIQQSWFVRNRQRRSRLKWGL